jgi:hypothetical protein
MAEARSDKAYWELMIRAALNADKRWPRGAERRHFRGQQAIDAVAELARKYRTAEEAVELWCSGGTFQRVSDEVQRNRGFGPWIAFKIADMSERVLGCDTDFSDCHLGIYTDPRKGAALVRFGDQNHPITDQELESTVDQYVGLWRQKRAKAPPRRDRYVNVQEIETIFCKYKSHINGHYPLGKDCREVRHGLHGWGDLAEHLITGVPSP